MYVLYMVHFDPKAKGTQLGVGNASDPINQVTIANWCWYCLKFCDLFWRISDKIQMWVGKFNSLCTISLYLGVRNNIVAFLYLNSIILSLIEVLYLLNN